jgi:hypothetical protein
MLFNVFSCLCEDGDGPQRLSTDLTGISKQRGVSLDKSSADKWSICEIKLEHPDLKADVTLPVRYCLHTFVIRHSEWVAGRRQQPLAVKSIRLAAIFCFNCQFSIHMAEQPFSF